MTKKKAIEISKELWTWLAETGKHKWDWGDWGRYGEMLSDCPLCEYARTSERLNVCGKCPYFKKFGRCLPFDLLDGVPTTYGRWQDAKTLEARKKYAKLFLEQLKQL